MKIIQKSTGKTLAEITTNHSMTLDEACDLMDIPVMRTEDDFAQEKGHDIDDLEMIL